jgi:hypothetical protein
MLHTRELGVDRRKVVYLATWVILKAELEYDRRFNSADAGLATT